MRDDPIEVLRRLGGDPIPTVEEERRARARLVKAIAAERPAQRGFRRVRWLVPALAAAALAVVVAGVFVARPSPVQAAFDQIAFAARLATPQEIPEGSFLYTRSVNVQLAITQGDVLGLAQGYAAFLVPTTREFWRNDAGFVQMSTTTRRPVFFSPEVEAAYYTHGLDKRDHVGETLTQQFVGVTDPYGDVEWPTDPRRLRDSLEAYVRQGGSTLPLDIQVFDLATDLLREADPGPDLRAALMQVFAQLPVTLVDQAPDGSVTLAVTYNRPPSVRDTITLDARGHLIAETSTLLEDDLDLGIPAGTRTSDATYTVPAIVDNLETNP
ncbi:hypothetical protein BMS3Abin02_00990 [bacterium BMS3Abin02]|nr:hypothetical protein BMS3Abin02_00990 [bacterium BMS3Abin02]HDL50261.1 hypothetical protein [Actinomycetota bacterium]